jgi:hypothetical protein
MISLPLLRPGWTTVTSPERAIGSSRCGPAMPMCRWAPPALHICTGFLRRLRVSNTVSTCQNHSAPPYCEIAAICSSSCPASYSTASIPSTRNSIFTARRLHYDLHQPFGCTDRDRQRRKPLSRRGQHRTIDRERGFVIYIPKLIDSTE